MNIVSQRVALMKELRKMTICIGMNWFVRLALRIVIPNILIAPDAHDFLSLQKLLHFMTDRSFPKTLPLGRCHTITTFLHFYQKLSFYVYHTTRRIEKQNFLFDAIFLSLRKLMSRYFSA